MLLSHAMAPLEQHLGLWQHPCLKHNSSIPLWHLGLHGEYWTHVALCGRMIPRVLRPRTLLWLILWCRVFGVFCINHNVSMNQWHDPILTDFVVLVSLIHDTSVISPRLHLDGLANPPKPQIPLLQPHSYFTTHDITFSIPTIWLSGAGHHPLQDPDFLASQWEYWTREDSFWATRRGYVAGWFTIFIPSPHPLLFYSLRHVAEFSLMMSNELGVYGSVYFIVIFSYYNPLRFSRSTRHTLLSSSTSYWDTLLLKRSLGEGGIEVPTLYEVEKKTKTTFCIRGGIKPRFLTFFYCIYLFETLERGSYMLVFDCLYFIYTFLKVRLIE